MSDNVKYFIEIEATYMPGFSLYPSSRTVKDFVTIPFADDIESVADASFKDMMERMAVKDHLGKSASEEEGKGGFAGEFLGGKLRMEESARRAARKMLADEMWKRDFKNTKGDWTATVSFNRESMDIGVDAEDLAQLLDESGVPGLVRIAVSRSDTRPTEDQLEAVEEACDCGGPAETDAQKDGGYGVGDPTDLPDGLDFESVELTPLGKKLLSISNAVTNHRLGRRGSEPGTDGSGDGFPEGWGSVTIPQVLLGRRDFDGHGKMAGTGGFADGAVASTDSMADGSKQRRSAETKGER